MADVTRQEWVKKAQEYVRSVRGFVSNWEISDIQRAYLAGVDAALTRPASPSDVELLEVFEDAVIAHSHCRGWPSVKKPTYAQYKLARSAVLARMRGAAVPEGCVVVPKEPTAKMLDAGLRHAGPDATAEDVYAIWRDALAAAPEVPR